MSDRVVYVLVVFQAEPVDFPEYKGRFQGVRVYSTKVDAFDAAHQHARIVARNNGWDCADIEFGEDHHELLGPQWWVELNGFLWEIEPMRVEEEVSMPDPGRFGD